ncbi:hypothetical protein VNO77_02870 [Canavalia gladiata]|uniref:Uncharacterized protein n=1 Tax=Canavalia gladiata TaxID=3824 RepID=A0AAN9MTW6_CANGL
MMASALGAKAGLSLMAIFGRGALTCMTLGLPIHPHVARTVGYREISLVHSVMGTHRSCNPHSMLPILKELPLSCGTKNLLFECLKMVLVAPAHLYATIGQENANGHFGLDLLMGLLAVS